MTLPNYEKLGVFYLGREYDLDADQLQDDLVLYDSKDLTTHAVCVGMTGSGKTGLCLSLLEEAAIDHIPVIAIDPKATWGTCCSLSPISKGKTSPPGLMKPKRCGMAKPKTIMHSKPLTAGGKVWLTGIRRPSGLQC